MRTIDKFPPDLFAALGLTLIATWFALIVMGMSSVIAHVLFLFSVAFVFELYSSSQEAKDAIREKEAREREEHLHNLLRDMEEGEGVEEWEEELHY